MYVLRNKRVGKLQYVSNHQGQHCEGIDWMYGHMTDSGKNKGILEDKVCLVLHTIYIAAAVLPAMIWSWVGGWLGELRFGVVGWMEGNVFNCEALWISILFEMRFIYKVLIDWSI